MDVERLARQVGVRDQDVVVKAREFVRMASVRLAGNSLGQGEVCKAAACLELACTSSNTLDRPPRDQFVRYGCTTAKVYQAAYNMLQKALQVQSRPPNLNDLATRLGAEVLLEPARSLLRLYQTRVLEEQQQQGKSGCLAAGLGQGSEPARSHADFSRPVFAVVAFHLLAKLGKVRIDARKLCKDLSITSTDFTHTLAAVSRLCADVLQDGEDDKGKGKKRGKGKGKGKGDIQEEENSGEEGQQGPTDDGEQQGKQGGVQQQQQQGQETGLPVKGAKDVSGQAAVKQVAAQQGVEDDLQEQSREDADAAAVGKSKASSGRKGGKRQRRGSSSEVDGEEAGEQQPKRRSKRRQSGPAANEDEQEEEEQQQAGTGKRRSVRRRC